MSVPHTPMPPSDAGPTPRKGKSVGAVLMMIVGAILLLPGLCSTFVFISFAITDLQNLFKFSDPIQQMVWILWGICLAVTLVGALLLRAGWRQ